MLPLKAWFDSHADQIFRDFSTFLSFPSISADPHYASDVRATADWLKSYLEHIGLQTEIWETSGYPIVFGSHLKAGPDKPTLLIYQHYDVQPVDPLELWHSDPFQATLKEGQIFARGAQDNKGQCFYSIQAIRAFLELAKASELNIKLFIEGEEESGSKGTFAFLKQNPEALKADHLLIVDVGIPEPGVPAIALGCRGIMTFRVTLRNGKIDLHSGEHGGIALNPIRALSGMLAKLWDEQGGVAIPDFYRDVQTLSDEELALYDLHFDQANYETAFGVKAFAHDPGHGPIASLWFRPSLEINGISGGYTGAGFKTVLPAEAVAHLSVRLVPNQEPDHIVQILSEFLEKHLPKGMTLKIEPHHGAPAYRSPYPSPLANICEESYKEVFKKDCKRILCGGSIPVVGALAQASGSTALLMGVGLADDNIHAPNEHFGWDRFEQGFLVMGGVLERLSNLKN